VQQRIRHLDDDNRGFQSWIIHFSALVLGILGKLNSIRMGTSLSAAQIALYIFQILLVDLIMVSGWFIILASYF